MNYCCTHPEEEKDKEGGGRQFGLRGFFLRRGEKERSSPSFGGALSSQRKSYFSEK